MSTVTTMTWTRTLHVLHGEYPGTTERRPMRRRMARGGAEGRNALSHYAESAAAMYAVCSADASSRDTALYRPAARLQCLI